MAATASLSVLLQAVTGDFDRKMKKSGKVVGRFGASIAKVGKRLAVMGTVAVAAATAAIVALTKAGLANVDMTSKLADRLGIATEQIERFRFAAQIGGVAADAMDKALERMVRSLGEAGQGLTTPIRGLETMGLRLEDLEKLKPDEQFLTIAEAISKIQDPLKRATASYQIFGRQGQKLLNTLMGGRAGIEALGKELDVLGLTFDRVSGAQVEAANDALTRLGVIVTGLSNRLAIELSPIIVEVAKRTADWITASGGIESVIVPALDKVIDKLVILERATQVFRIFGNVITGVFNAFVALAGSVGIVVTAVGRFIGIFDKLTTDTALFFAAEFKRAMITDIKDIEDAFKRLWDPRFVGEFFEAVDVGAKKIAESVEGAVDKAAGESVEVISNILKNLAKVIIERSLTPLEKFTRDIEKLQEVFEKGLIPQEVFEKETERLKKFLEEAQKITDKPKKDIDLTIPDGGGTRVFRFAASITAGVQKKQLTTLLEILSTLRDQHRDQFIVNEVEL